MKDIIIIQGRMSSSRLPGKILELIEGKPLLQWVIERAKLSCIKDIVVATSTETSDDPVENFCRSVNLKCFRGELDDVAGRFQYVLEQTKVLRFVRICADSPFIDPALIDCAVKLFDETEVDIVTNVYERTFPKGQSVEMLKADVFVKAQPFSSIEDKEHVTRYFYENADRYKIKNFDSGGAWEKNNMCVDTIEDMKRVKKYFKSARRNILQERWQEILRDLENVEV